MRAGAGLHGNDGRRQLADHGKQPGSRDLAREDDPITTHPVQVKGRFAEIDGNKSNVMLPSLG